MTFLERDSQDLEEAKLELPPIGNGHLVDVQLGTVRYDTMKSVYRGRDEDRQRAMSLEKPAADIVKPDSKEILDIAIARLDLGNKIQQKVHHRTEHVLPISDYVKRRKCYLYMKGLKFNQLYSVHRNREEKLWDEIADSKSTFPKLKRRPKRIGQSMFTLPPISELNGTRHPVLGPDDKDESRMKYKFGDKGKMSWEKRIVARVQERTLTANKPTRKTNMNKRNAKNLVSSNRLRQVLDGPGVLSVSHFYNG